LHVVFLDQLLLPVDGIVEFNVPPNPFPVKTAFLIIQCWINQLLLYKSLVFDFYCLFPFIQTNGEHTRIFFFHSRTVHLDIIKVFYSPTDAQENCFKKNIKIYIKTAPTCFGAITIIRERILWAR